MNPEEMENDTPENETVDVAPESTEEKAPAPEAESAESKELQSALAQKEHFRQKAEKAEKERKALEAQLNKRVQNGTQPALDVEDYIDINTALSGLDTVEQAYLAKMHKLTGEAMKDIRESEDFQLWNSAYRAKLEKEAALKPTNTQVLEEQPGSLAQQLAKASTIAEREKILREHDLWRDPRPKADRTNIGPRISG